MFKKKKESSIVTEEISSGRRSPGLLLVGLFILVPSSFPRIRRQPITLDRIEIDNILLVHIQYSFRFDHILGPRASRVPQRPIVVRISVSFRVQRVALILERVPIVSRVIRECRIMPPITVRRVRLTVMPIGPSVRRPKHRTRMITSIPPVILVQIVISSITFKGTGAIIVRHVR